MKTKYGCILALLVVVVLLVLPTGAATAGKKPAGDACGPRQAKAGGGTWSCTFVDNFDGTTLNRAKW